MGENMTLLTGCDKSVTVRSAYSGDLFVLHEIKNRGENID